MKQALCFPYEDELIEASQQESLALITIKCDVYSAITSLAESGRLLALMRAAEIDPQTKALVLNSNPECFSREEFDNFFDQIRPLSGRQDCRQDEAHLKNERMRYANLLNRFIVHLLAFRKISVALLPGEVVAPFFGASLAADFRMAGSEMVFLTNHSENILHPGGALPFFLPRYLGPGRATEILLTGRSIAAGEALELGLVNQVLEPENFLEQALQEVRKLCRLPLQSVMTAKMLMSDLSAEFPRYLDREAVLLH